MTLKDKFLKEIKIADRVELMIGQGEMRSGVVVALDLDTVRIRRENGNEAVLSLEAISYYEIGENRSDQSLLNEENSGNHSPSNEESSNNAEEEKKEGLQNTRSLGECPNFTAAEKARMDEKDLKKAEKLYKKAINKNEKTGSAVANLFQILFQQRRFRACAYYLGRYGSKYMREESYNNLKKQLLISAPKLRSEIVKYEKEDVLAVDYFVMAQKAEVEEKDLQKAITYYKKAINTKTKLSGAIPNLVSIYSRLEMYEEALDLLDTNGQNVMDKNAYLNLKQSVLTKAKDKKYEDVIEDTYSQMMELASSIEKKTEVAASKAKLFFQIGNYEEAIKIYEYCLENCLMQNYAKEKKERHQLYVFIGLCNVYIQIDKIEKAQEYARKILEIDSSNEFARLILEGKIGEDVGIAEEITGVTEVMKYIKDRIEVLSLESEVKDKKLIEDGKFIGTQQEAATILKNIRDFRKRSANEAAKSNQYIAGAKLILQIQERDEDIDPKEFGEKQFLYYVAEGACAYANDRIYRNDSANNLDVARYFYLQPLSIYNEPNNKRLTWKVATIRYIRTFFDSIENIRKDGNSEYLKIRSIKDCIGKIQQVVKEGELQTSYKVLTIGMMELFKCNPKIKEDVLGIINLSHFQGKILDSLAEIIGEQIPDIYSEEDFKVVWDDATKVYYSLRYKFFKLIAETIESLFAVGQLRENLEKIKNDPFNNLLNNTDREYMKTLYTIFDSIVRYNESGEFAQKADTLKRAEEDRKVLEEEIKGYPTYLSYEMLLPQLEKIQREILEEFVSLYRDSEPQLSVSLLGDCSLDAKNKIVKVPVAFANRANSQAADNVQIRVWGEGVKNKDDSGLSRGWWPGDGRAIAKMLIFGISDKVLSDQVFSIEMSITYQYKKNMTEVQEGEANFVLSVPLSSESVFEPIDNKFMKISGGNLVTDADMFYGRDKEIESIINQIQNTSLDNKNGKCLALYGQTRTGKSSILFHLKEQLRKHSENIIIDIGSLGRLGSLGPNISEFLQKILRQLDKEIERNHGELADALKDRGVKIESKSISENPEQSQSKFDDIFGDVYEVIKEQDTPYHIVLMIDEFTYIYDWIRQGTMTDRIMKFWKAFMQTYSIFAIIIGQDHMMQFIADYRFTNDFGIMETMKVSYLSEDDAKRLMDEPILYKTESGKLVSRYKEGALDRLYELTSGSAFLIGKLCDGLVEYLNKNHSVFITRAHVDDYIKKILPTVDEIIFDPQYRDLSEIGEESSTIIEKNKTMLKRIAVLSNKKEYTSVDAVVQSDEDREILKKLEQRDVVIVRGDRCKIKVALYKEWLIEKNGLGVI